MEDLNIYIQEGIFDNDHEEKMEDLVYLEKFNSMLSLGNGGARVDQFGRKINIGDICFYDWGGESCFIQVKDFDKYGDIIPTKDYSRITGENIAYSACCILIPKHQYNNFLKVIKK